MQMLLCNVNAEYFIYLYFPKPAFTVLSTFNPQSSAQWRYSLGSEWQLQIGNYIPAPDMLESPE